MQVTALQRLPSTRLVKIGSIQHEEQGQEEEDEEDEEEEEEEEEEASTAASAAEEGMLQKIGLTFKVLQN